MTKAQCVFLVDDDRAARSGLARLLRAAGYPVREFASANEFLDALERARLWENRNVDAVLAEVSDRWRLPSSRTTFVVVEGERPGTLLEDPAPAYPPYDPAPTEGRRPPVAQREPAPPPAVDPDDTTSGAVIGRRMLQRLPGAR